MNRRALLLFSVAALCGLVYLAVLLPGKGPRPNEREVAAAESVTPATPQTVGVRVQEAGTRITVEPLPVPSDVPMPVWAHETVDALRKKGFRVSDQLRLPSGDAWRQLVEAWEGTTKEVTRTQQAWYELGCRLGAERLENGDYERYDSLHYPPPMQGQPDLRPWQLNRDRDWVTVRTRFDPNKGYETYDVVRIMPGDSPLMDRAVEEKTAALELRRLTMESLINR